MGDLDRRPLGQDGMHRVNEIILYQNKIYVSHNCNNICTNVSAMCAWFLRCTKHIITHHTYIQYKSCNNINPYSLYATVKYNRYVVPPYSVKLVCHRYLATSTDNESKHSSSTVDALLHRPMCTAPTTHSKSIIAEQSNGLNKPSTKYTINHNDNTIQSITSLTHKFNTSYTQLLFPSYHSYSIQLLLTPVSTLLYYFLPANYPISVKPTYAAYSMWSTLTTVISSATGVLCTHSLLIAVGLSSSVALPSAAIWNWILKDGLGQLGGVLFTSVVGQRFDDDAKRWRLLSAISLDIAQLLELLTPYIPGLFLPLATLANTGKNISWISASACKASIHRSLACNENLADITAKSGTQAIAASLLGTGIGMMISYITGAITTNNYNTLIIVYLLLTSTHIYTTYRSVQVVALNTLNIQRSERNAINYIQYNNILTVDQISQHENFILKYKSKLDIYSRLCYSSGVLGSTDKHIYTLCDITNDNNTLQQLIQLYHQHKFICNLSIHGDPLDMNAATRYAINNSKSIQVIVLLLDGCTSHDILQSYLFTVKLRILLNQLIVTNNNTITTIQLLNIVTESIEWLSQYGENYLNLLNESNWNTQHLFIERDPSIRLKFIFNESKTL